MATCPSGHDTAATDYCDVCGLPVGEAPSIPADAAAPAAGAADTAADSGTCPHCGGTNPVDALFCEACGYDFTTGTPPRPLTPMTPAAEAADDAPAPAAAPVAGPAAGPAAGPVATSTPGGLAPSASAPWVVEVWIDPDWYADQESDDPLPSAGVPSVVALRSTSALVGRASRSRGISPDVDLGADNGISRRHCQLTTDGTRWWVEDLGSSNGTYVGPAIGPLPTTPVPAGERREVGPDDRVYLGAWTRLVLRRAQPGEV